jgi:hypothetical protein
MLHTLVYFAWGVLTICWAVQIGWFAAAVYSSAFDDLDSKIVADQS